MLTNIEKKQNGENMLIYEILTWLIIQLGKLREWYIIHFKNGFFEREDRDKINRIYRGQIQLKYDGFGLICCDCGLTHKLKNWNDKDLHCIPYRPKNYKYKLR